MNFKNFFLILIGVAFVCFLYYYFSGHNAFKGGDYKANITGVNVSFKDGKLIYNDKEVGTYSSFYNELTVYTDNSQGEIKGKGVINDTYVTIDFPGTPSTWLVKVEPKK